MSPLLTPYSPTILRGHSPSPPTSPIGRLWVAHSPTCQARHRPETDSSRRRQSFQKGSVEPRFREEEPEGKLCIQGCPAE